jgi:hypothetical protein
VSRTKAELERTFRDVVAPDYARPLEELEEGVGWDPVAAGARVLERTSGAITRNASSFYLLPHSQEEGPSASGARLAEGLVRAERVGSVALEHTYPAGTMVRARVRDSRGAYHMTVDAFELAEDLKFTAGTRAQSVRVRARRPGESGNVAPGTLIGLVLEDDADPIALVQTEALAGGAHATLDAIGRERNMPRAGAREADLDYAYRLSVLPDVVSPAAIDRLCAQILSPLGIRYEILETQTHLPGFILDHTPLDTGSLRENDPWRGALLLSDQQSKRFFTVLVEDRPELGGGLPVDAQNAGINAYDVADRAGDGKATQYFAALKALYGALEPARAGGVSWQLRTAPKPMVTHSAWSKLYALDLRTLPSLSLGAGSGTVTLAGVDWLVRGGGGVQEVVAGAGLRLRTTGGDLTPALSTATLAKILVATVPGYQSGRPTAVLVRLSGLIEGDRGAGAVAWCGSEVSATVLSNFTSLRARSDGEAEWVAAGGPQEATGSLSHQLDGWVMGILLSGDTRIRQGVWGRWEGRFPAIEELSASKPRIFDASVPSGLAGGGAVVRAGAGIDAVFDVTHVLVLQR